MRPRAGEGSDMKRRLGHFCVLLSLLIFLAGLGVWVRSYFVRDLVVRQSEWIDPTLAHSSAVLFFASRGRVVFGYDKIAQLLPAPQPAGLNGPPLPKGHIRWDWMRDAPSSLGVQRWFNKLGFGYNRRPYNKATGSETYAWIPCWFVMLLSATLPTIVFARARRARRRQRTGCCSRCGYDLRASPDRCPECGAINGAEAAR